MAKVKSMGYTDTPVEGVTELTFPRAILNFGKDFRVKSNNAGKEVVLTNITSPVDRPEKIRIAYTDVANVYSGTGVEASVLAPTKRGVSILAQVTETISVTDDTDPDYLSTYLYLTTLWLRYLRLSISMLQMCRLD